jgi:hypothetical protein
MNYSLFLEGLQVVLLAGVLYHARKLSALGSPKQVEDIDASFLLPPNPEENAPSSQDLADIKAQNQAILEGQALTNQALNVILQRMGLK